MILDRGLVLWKLSSICPYNGLIFKLKVVPNNNLDRNLHILMASNSGMIPCIDSIPSQEASLWMGQQA